MPPQPTSIHEYHHPPRKGMREDMKSTQPYSNSINNLHHPRGRHREDNTHAQRHLSSFHHELHTPRRKCREDNNKPWNPSSIYDVHSPRGHQREDMPRQHPLSIPDLPPLAALRIDEDCVAPVLMNSAMRLSILKSAMFLRQSNATLQDELRDTMKSYVEEKQVLRAQLANLRLDLQELHNDDRTVTSDDTASYISMGNTSEPELKELEEGQGDTGRSSLQLPAIGNTHLTPGRKAGEEGGKSKSLRFITRNNTGIEELNKGKGNNKSFLTDSDKKENQKFQELQKNQEVLRNIGRANLREKRQSLIRLPTISSAKRRTALWDSGKNVSRPKGKSTVFETHPYVQESIVLSKKIFKIPKIKDSHRSEIQLGDMKKLDMNKKKVQFTRPRPELEQGGSEKQMNTNVTISLDNSRMGGESLNTTLADTTMADTTYGNISFDEEQLKVLKELKTHRSMGDISEASADTTVAKEATLSNNSSKDTSMSQPLPNTLDNTDGLTPDVSKTSKTHDHNTSNQGDPSQSLVPPLKLKSLAKKNVQLHNQLTSSRATPTGQLPPIKVGGQSDKSSDRSTVGTKVSRLSQETEEWKSLYMAIPDPDVRKKTLSDIMFAVRSRMRENEAALRFGETPQASDHTYCDYLLSKHTPRWGNGGTSPRKSKAPANKKTTRKGTIPINTAVRAEKRKDTTGQLQSYLRKMYRQRRTIDRMAGEEYRLAHFAGHKELQMVAQEV